MLVLTRKLMEKLYIGTDVCVTVVRLEGGQVRLGIEAPREVAVVRAELIDGRAAAPDTTPPPVVADWPPAPSTPIAPTPPTPHAVGRPPVKIRPGATRGIGIPHREPSR